MTVHEKCYIHQIVSAAIKHMEEKQLRGDIDKHSENQEDRDTFQHSHDPI